MHPGIEPVAASPDGTNTTGPPPASRRRRRRHTSRIGRILRAVGLGTDGSRLRNVIAIVAVAVAIGATALVIGGGTHQAVVPPASASASQGVAAGGSPGTTATLPAIPTPPASGSPSASTEPAGVVAKRIRIDQLGIDLRIVEGDGVDAPLNKAAHYPGTGWPGGGTNIYIYAHAQTGMFLSLWDAQVGDAIVLDLADGTTARYVVTVVKPKVAWNALQYLAPTPTEQLTLQTSTSYTATAPRFVVIAVPAP